MKKLINFLFFSLCCITLQAQESKIRNKTIFVEAGGNGYNVSLNYDMRFNKNSNSGLGFRVGTSAIIENYPISKDRLTRWTFPLEINYLLGKKLHFLDLGIGLTPHYVKYEYGNPLFITSKDLIYLTVPSIGYRFQGKKGLMLKANYTPNFRYVDLPDEKIHISQSIGLCVGYSF